MDGEGTGANPAQALWDEVNTEREAEQSPSNAFPVDAAPAEDELQDNADAQVTDASAETAAKAAPAATQAAAVDDDPFAGLSPALRQRFERLEQYETQVQQIPQLLARVNTAEGRVASMQRERDVAKSAAQAVKAAPTTAQIAAASGSLDKWDTLKADFPEWAEATEQFLAAKLAGLPQPAVGEQLDPTKVAELIEQKTSGVRAEMGKLIEEAKIEGKYADWRTVVNTPEFVQWFGVQAPNTQALARSPVGRDAIRMLDLFHEAKATPADAQQQTRQAKLAAAVTTKPGVSATTATAKTVDQMSPAELWEHERKRAAKRGEARGLHY